MTSHHITHHKPKEENTKKKFLGRVLGPDGILTTSHIITSHHIRHHKPKEENTKKKFLGRVLGPDGILTTSHIITSHHIRHHKPKDAISPHHTSHIIVTSDITSHPHHITHHCISPDSRHHISPYHTSQAERREHKEEVLGPSSWAEWHSHHITQHHISAHQTSQAERRNLTTSHITHHCDIRHHISPYHTSQAKRREHKEEVLGPSSWAEFLGRMAFSPHHTSSHLTTSDITSRKGEKVRVLL